MNMKKWTAVEFDKSRFMSMPSVFDLTQDFDSAHNPGNDHKCQFSNK